jgi:hypothetical protein
MLPESAQVLILASLGRRGGQDKRPPLFIGRGHSLGDCHRRTREKVAEREGAPGWGPAGRENGRCLIDQPRAWAKRLHLATGPAFIPGRQCKR